MYITVLAHGDRRPLSASGSSQSCRSGSWTRRALPLLLLAALFAAPRLLAQDPSQQDVKPVPLFSGSAGFITTFTAGETHLGPIVTPVVLVPLGQRWLFETRIDLESDLAEVPGVNGFHGTLEKNVDYAQLDFIANRYMTVTVGRFLTPFNIFNERLYPVWIRNLQTDPLILPIGIGPSNASDGAMVRGGFNVQPGVDVNYAAYFSTLVNTTYVDASRFVGGRAGVFIRKTRLELGGSFQHSLQDNRANAFGFHAIWEPFRVPLELRSEYARSFEGSGYWGEAAYRLSQLPLLQHQMRHSQVVARMQQAFAGASPDTSLYPANMKMFEFGLNYYFIDGVKATSSYGRQFSPAGNANVWTLGLTYRFVVSLGNAWRN